MARATRFDFADFVQTDDSLIQRRPGQWIPSEAANDMPMLNRSAEQGHCDFGRTWIVATPGSRGDYSVGDKHELIHRAALNDAVYHSQTKLLS